MLICLIKLFEIFILSTISFICLLLNSSIKLFSNFDVILFIFVVLLSIILVMSQSCSILSLLLCSIKLISSGLISLLLSLSLSLLVLKDTKFSFFKECPLSCIDLQISIIFFSILSSTISLLLFNSLISNSSFSFIISIWSPSPSISSISKSTFTNILFSSFLLCILETISLLYLFNNVFSLLKLELN